MMLEPLAKEPNPISLQISAIVSPNRRVGRLFLNSLMETPTTDLSKWAEQHWRDKDKDKDKDNRGKKDIKKKTTKKSNKSKGEKKDKGKKKT
jgi:hypothetical protein